MLNGTESGGGGEEVAGVGWGFGVWPLREAGAGGGGGV